MASIGELTRHLCCAFFENVTPEVFVLVPTDSSSVALLQLRIPRHCVAQRGKGAVHIGARCRWKIAHACCRWPLPSCLPNSPPHLTVSCAKQGLCTRYPSTGGQPGVTEPLAARPRTPPGLAGKSQLCCQATAGGPSGSCLPRPGPPRVRSKPPRPWPGARTSSPAQMPPGSWRVGTCLRPRAGIGTRAARPPHLCLPGCLLFCSKFPPGGLGQLPPPQAQQEA